MNARTLFRILVAGEWIVVVVGTGVGLALESRLPPALREFLREQSRDPHLGEHPVAFYSAVALLIVWAVSSVGLFFFRSWAPRLYLGTLVAILALSGFGAPTVSPAPFELFDHAATLISGVIIGWLFLADRTLPFGHHRRVVA